MHICIVIADEHYCYLCNYLALIHTSNVVYNLHIITIIMSLDGTPPYDGYEVDTIHQNHLALIIIYDIAAFVGLIFVAVCLVFDIVFRNKTSVSYHSLNTRIYSLTLPPV